MGKPSCVNGVGLLMGPSSSEVDSVVHCFVCLIRPSEGSINRNKFIQQQQNIHQNDGMIIKFHRSKGSTKRLSNLGIVGGGVVRLFIPPLQAGRSDLTRPSFIFQTL